MVFLEPVTVTVLLKDEQRKLKFSGKDCLLEALREEEYYIPAICGGKGTCGKCKIKLEKGALDITGADAGYFSKSELDAGLRLSCMAFPKEDITVSILTDDEKNFQAVTFFEQGTEQGAANAEIAAARADGNKTFSIAVDIGTTTIATALVSLSTGAVIDNITVVNKQREYGADVISRILNASKGKLKPMSMAVRTQISQCIQEICERNGVIKEAVSDVAIVANTTMIHLLLELNCETLGVYPFTPVTLAHMNMAYNELFDGGLNARVHILPGISTYVGADITAGILFSELYKKTKPSFLLDIGTNGEMAVCKDGRIYCTATAAGPAFEGGNISWGTGSVFGAISAAKYSGNQFEITTIGDAPPIGICGSGVIDIVYECLRNGLINKTGRFDKSYGNDGVILAKTADEQNIRFTQKDVRELQLGKSAIRSGIDTLLSFTGLEYGDIDALYIAGGFGFRINFESGAGLGLIPAEMKDKITLIGNSSLGGAVKYLLNNSSGDELKNIIEMAEEHSLPEDKMFNKLFIENMSF